MWSPFALDKDGGQGMDMLSAETTAVLIQMPLFHLILNKGSDLHGIDNLGNFLTVIMRARGNYAGSIFLESKPIAVKR